VQAAGPFPQVKGSRILHDKLKAFIHRNYLADEAADAVEAGHWVPEEVRFADLPARFGYVLSPQARRS
jgi:hypothetical protein